MENEFIPYEQALALKELCFDEHCLTFYNYDKRIERSDDWAFGVDMENKRDRNECLAPLYQQAFRWLWNKTGKYIIPIQKNDKEWLAIGIVYKTYEEAELECLKKLIEIVKKINKNE